MLRLICLLLLIDLSLSQKTNVFSFGSLKGGPKPVLGFTNLAIYADTNGNIVSFNIDGTTYGGSGGTIACHVASSTSNINLLQMQIPAPTFPNADPPLNYFSAIISGTNCNAGIPNDNSVSFTSMKEGGYSFSITNIFCDESYVYGLQLSPAGPIDFTIGHNNAPEIYSFSDNILDPGTLWITISSFSVTGMATINQVYNATYGYVTPPSSQCDREYCTAVAQIKNASKNFNIGYIQFRSLYRFPTVSYISTNIDDSYVQLGGPVGSGLASFITSNIPLTLVGYGTCTGFEGSILCLYEFSNIV
jgi:hypothetical protein